MKKYTHAWLAFMAIKRLEEKKAGLADDDRKYAEKLIKWFKDHKDGVINGAWYPDDLIKDMADKHVLKFAPYDKAPAGTVSMPPEKIKALPKEYLIYQYGEQSPVRQKAFNVTDPNDNLPDRCESIAEAVIDQLKVQEDQDKGSPVAPTDNQVALWLFMLSHYVADAHVPVHCDSRPFSSGKNIHGLMEKTWDDEIKKFFEIDKPNNRFFYDIGGYPARAVKKNSEKAYEKSFLSAVEEELQQRAYESTFGPGNKNVWDFMNAICHRSYLVSYRFFPPQYECGDVTGENWKTLASPELSLEQLSAAVLADAIDSISRVWFRIWRRYEKWVHR